MNVGKGIVDIGGDLRLQGEDAAGNAAVGTGYITMTETEGKLNIGRNFILQSSASGKYEYGIITLKGDLTQLDTYNNFVGKYGHRVILAGDGAQQVSFKNNNNTFNILELKKAMSNYKFSPARCWVTLVGVNPEWPFVDIPINENNWKYKSAKYVYENNIMSGMNSADGTVVFQPDTPMNRAMFAAVIYRMAGNPDVSYEPVFTDVAPGKWYSDAIVWAYKRGIVSGYSDGRFGVNDNITREQMARMLKEYADVQKYGTSERGNVDTFVDSKNISKWATEYVKWAVGSGLISGKIENGQKYIDPRGNATRAECASMLMRFIEKYQK